MGTRGPRKNFTFVLAVCVLALVWTVRFLGPDPTQIQQAAAPDTQKIIDHARPPPSIPAEKQLDLTHLEHLVRTPIFDYSRRVIKTEHFVGSRPDLTILDQRRLTPPSIEVYKDFMSNTTTPNVPPLTLRVPSSPVVDTSILSFGIATTVPRLQIAIPQIQHWLPSSSAQLHVLTPEHVHLARVEASAQESGLNMTITPTPLPFPKAYFSLLKTLYETKTPKTKWLVLVDDDTFFPSLSYLVDHLNKKYDSQEELLVAATSDNLGQIYGFGLIPFGGGGIFISIPLAERLLQPDIFKTCLDTETDQGDQILNNCLNEHTSIRPTFDRGLNQMDIRGGNSPEAGYFESGRRMLSVHHWRSWFNFDVALAGNVSIAAGDESIFQRWLFDSDTVLSNGYSIARYISPALDPYEKAITEKELAGVEYTWNDGDESEKWRYVHSHGPLRPMKSVEQKKTLKLVAAEEVVAQEGKAVRQIYVWRDSREEVGSEVDNIKRTDKRARDEVVELVWLI